jgi:hypothetical protein
VGISRAINSGRRSPRPSAPMRSMK